MACSFPYIAQDGLLRSGTHPHPPLITKMLYWIAYEHFLGGSVFLDRISSSQATLAAVIFTNKRTNKKQRDQRKEKGDIIWDISQTLEVEVLCGQTRRDVINKERTIDTVSTDQTSQRIERSRVLRSAPQKQYWKRRVVVAMTTRKQGGKQDIYQMLAMLGTDLHAFHGLMNLFKPTRVFCDPWLFINLAAYQVVLSVLYINFAQTSENSRCSSF